MGRESLYYCSGNAFPGMNQWFFDIPSKLIHWRLNLVRALGAYVPWLRRDDGSMKVHAGTLVDLFATILSGRRPGYSALYFPGSGAPLAFQPF